MSSLGVRRDFTRLAAKSSWISHRDAGYDNHVVGNVRVFAHHGWLHNALAVDHRAKPPQLGGEDQAVGHRAQEMADRRRLQALVVGHDDRHRGVKLAKLAHHPVLAPLCVVTGDPHRLEQLHRVIPVSRVGTDDATNLATTSILRNQAKSNWTLAELGWFLHEPGTLAEWDGLCGWFNDYVAHNPDVLHNLYLKKWHMAATSIIKNLDVN